MRYFSNLQPEQNKFIDAFIQQTLPAQMAALQAFIRIPSVKSPPVGGYPFGAPIHHALEYALKHARLLGFDTKNLDGYAGVIDYGQGEETLGILAHVDVVPAGEGWTLPPFSGEIKSGRICGRGASDDKGPAISAVYALAAVAAARIPLKRRVRIILGCDEESGWDCMAYYKLHEPMPALAFSPDAEYPLVYSEKAILHATFTRKHTGSYLQIRCGQRLNVVPGLAEAYISGEHTNFPSIPGFQVLNQLRGNETYIRVEGLSAHASTPERGSNALQALLQVLGDAPLHANDAATLLALRDMLKLDMHGESLGIDQTDESGRLTLNPGLLHWDAEGVTLGFDARIPHCMATETILVALRDALAPLGFSLRDSHIQPGHIVQRDSELVRTLMQVYCTQTGDMQAEPLAIGGGTYARAMPSAVAFGCEWPGSPPVAHMPDEYIALEDMAINTHMMADAILALAGE